MSGRHAIRSRPRIEPWLAFLVTGGLVAVVSAVVAPDSPWLPGLLQAAGIGTAVVGLVRHEPGNRYLWWLMISGCGCWTIASAAARGAASVQSPQPVPAVVLLVAYAVVAVSLVLLTRQPGQRIANAVDAAVITTALLVLVWTFAVRPLLATPWPLSLSTLLGLGHAAASGVLVIAVLRFVATEQRPGAASTLLSVAALAFALADVGVAAPISGTAGLVQLGAVASQGWAIAFGAAALHPSSVRLRVGLDEPGPAISRQRFLTFVIFALAVPATPFAAWLVAVSSGQHVGVVTLLPTTLVAVAVSVLTVLRLGLIARMAQQQAQDLRRALRHRAALERELRQRATHDPLTGLANRAVLLDRLERTLSPAGNRNGTLIVINLDGFKDVNDTLGHEAGDAVLVAVAERLQATVDDTDLVARLGGDEFAVLCAGGAEGRTQARRVLDALRPGYRAGEVEIHLSGTAGMLDLADTATAADALRDADLALHAAKEIGKDQLVTFHPSMLSARVQRSDLAAGLRRALAEGSLSVHYQPVVDLSNGRMAAVEALARWTGEDGRAIPPMEFIPVAEETGLIVKVGEFVLRRACTAARPWHERYGIAVTVNVSAHQLREPDFVDSVLAVLAETGLPAKALVLELTETTMITDVEETAALEVLRSHGVRVAIDDFGTGYSSLSYLMRLPVDILKIDREFTSPVSKQVSDRWAFMRAILDLANSLQLVTIAEGVETDQQAHTLRNLDCQLAQGYLYSRPVPATAVTELLSAWNARAAASESPTAVLSLPGDLSVISRAAAVGAG